MNQKCDLIRINYLKRGIQLVPQFFGITVFYFFNRSTASVIMYFWHFDKSVIIRLSGHFSLS